MTAQRRHLPLQHTHCSGETLMEEEFLATLTDSQVEEEHLGLKWQRQGWHLFSTLDELKAEA
ncbi:hypothetical protein K438DRAFT_1868139 [Mycena galopus ATCC 62051]|nr:hypothetical protein K438DRAFT_1868139 [Mycena galopus ATCC 62051]